MGSNEYLVVRIGIIIKRVFVVSKLHVEFYAPFALILLFFLSCESDLCFLIILKTRIKMLIIPFYLRIKLSEIIFAWKFSIENWSLVIQTVFWFLFIVLYFSSPLLGYMQQPKDVVKLAIPFFNVLIFR